MTDPQAGAHRWVDVGRSSDADSAVAGAQAAAAALCGREAKLVVVFSSVAHDVRAVVDSVNEVSGHAPLIGCSSHGEIGVDGPRDDSVVVAALGGPGFSIATAAATDVAGRQREAGAQIATSASAVEERPHSVLLLLTDGLIPDQEEILRGVYGVVGASVPLAGGAAADRWTMNQTWQFHGDQVLSGAVVGALIASDAPLGVGIGHGWRKVGEPMIVTSAANGVVYTLDDRPALDVYLGRFNAPDRLGSDRRTLSEFALARPIGIQRRSGEEVRNLSTGIDAEQRSFRPGGDIHEGGLVWAMEGDDDSILQAVDLACASATDALGGREPIGLLTFSCAATRAVVGDEGIRREGARLTDRARGVPFGGFYTYGEIARTRGIDGFHNQTLVVLAIS
jgi:hypothetical protein